MKKKKVLFVATVVKIHIMVFHIPYLEWLKKNGYEVHVAAKNDYENKEDCIIPHCDKFFDLPFERFPLKKNNINVQTELKKIIDANEYELIHCHTPMGGVLGRLATREARKKGTKTIYTAHGFHFYRGAPLINWLIYYPIERWLARYTDVLITINKEDFGRAEKLKAKKVEYVPGIGIDIERFKENKVSKDLKRKELGLEKDTFILLSVGELNKNKNHEVAIRALSQISNKKIHYIICGQGHLDKKLKLLSEKLGVENQVHLLGFRNDILEICKVSDLFVFPSYREGLSVSLMEAMACGLPIVCSNIRGNSDLVEEAKGGYLVKPNDINAFSDKILEIYSNKDAQINFSNFNLKKINEYSLKNTLKITNGIYNSILKKNSFTEY